MRRLRTTEQRATYGKWFKAVRIGYGSLGLLLLTGLAIQVVHGARTSAAALAAAPTPSRTTPAQQLGMVVIWASMVAIDW